MSALSAAPGEAAGAVFDRMASTYDVHFTESHIGRAQRDMVWRALLRTFCTGDHLLELNCGTGEDALFLATQGISVLACDASRQMIREAQHRLRQQGEALPVVFCHLPTERLNELDPTDDFSGAFSNFSGLNCIEDLAFVAGSLARRIRPGGRLLLCMSTRWCLVEILYYLFRLQPLKAFRRVRGRAQAMLEGTALTVYYPTAGQIRHAFAPHFKLRTTTAVGVTIPPSYLESWAKRHLRIFSFLRRLEPLLASLPLLRTTGDHVLLSFERVRS